MYQNNTLVIDETPEMAFVNKNEAIKTVVGMLTPAAAAETASFMVDTSIQLCPEAMRGHPDTPPATSLREYHFTVLMTNAARAYAEGRGQDFADDRSALDRLLREEPEHQPLAARFRELMGLWLRDECDRRRQAEMIERVRKRLRREAEEREMMEELEREKAEEGERSGGEEEQEVARDAEQEVMTGGEDSPSSSYTASAGSQTASEGGDDMQGSPTPARVKSVFDPSGLVDTDEDGPSGNNDSSSDDDDDSSGDEEIIARK